MLRTCNDVFALVSRFTSCIKLMEQIPHYWDIQKRRLMVLVVSWSQPDTDIVMATHIDILQTAHSKSIEDIIRFCFEVAAAIGQEPSEDSCLEYVGMLLLQQY